MVITDHPDFFFEVEGTKVNGKDLGAAITWSLVNEDITSPLFKKPTEPMKPGCFKELQKQESIDLLKKVKFGRREIINECG